MFVSRLTLEVSSGATGTTGQADVVAEELTQTADHVKTVRSNRLTNDNKMIERLRKREEKLKKMEEKLKKKEEKIEEKRKKTEEKLKRRLDGEERPSKRERLDSQIKIVKM